jgi:hypothetical protein
VVLLPKLAGSSHKCGEHLCLRLLAWPVLTEQIL